MRRSPTSFNIASSECSLLNFISCLLCLINDVIGL
ncbi:hypothetical protein BMETH_2004_0 [methanotrophic bacterial endosymbiont of Bathymodiolus sp.]|nr:hypothetical protein BMETH_2004_0 [methanotrophic bacterial endosymbiont of Bathymodiolus sp.]